MLEADELKQLLTDETELSNEKESLTPEEKQFFEGVLKEPLDKIGNAIGKVIGEEMTVSNINTEIVKAELLKETLDAETYFPLDAMINGHLTTFIIDIATVKNVHQKVTEEMAEEGAVSSAERATWGEALDQAVNSFTNALSKNSGVEMTHALDKEKESEIFTHGSMLQVSFSLVSNTIDTTAYYILSYELLNEIIKAMRPAKAEEPASSGEETEKKEEQTTQNTEELEEINATVQPIKFEEFNNNCVGSEKENMSLLMDLQLQVSVELGKVKKPIKEILQFTQGTIVELDRLAGENVDILVSGKIIAKGEVVVVDQNFGVRITEIVIPEKRV